MSHVWCDGLGNPSANALPKCQILRLNRCLRSMPPDMESGELRFGPLSIDWTRQNFSLHPERSPPLFWMDTLCIPVQPQHAALRTRAINQMASIYAAAVQVLVLDAELAQCATAGAPAAQLLARIVCSAWMGRSWTLQEGVLARECVFQFADAALDPVHAWCLGGARYSRARSAASATPIAFPREDDAAETAVYVALYNAFWDALHQDWKSSYRRDPPPRNWRSGLGGSKATGRVNTLPTAAGVGSPRDASGLDANDHFTMELDPSHRVKQLVDTWNELAHRSTTVPEDLHVIVANLLDFNADAVMERASREERMLAMMLSFEVLPMSLFWNTKGKRWCGVGSNGWVPVEPRPLIFDSFPALNCDPRCTLSRRHFLAKSDRQH
ncbi:Het domain-containing protein [Neofusicoccum parvum]|uniref:Het domain-containing protein n=1 Tax=Neofusicoccum parvum TaxID=310453 RepID=A0ACB5SED3_9PEZI|nr:Het domain-containing protein [Neofusicoccum parvum]